MNLCYRSATVCPRQIPFRTQKWSNLHSAWPTPSHYIASTGTTRCCIALHCIVSLTNGIDLIHEDDARLMVPCVVEHFSDQPCTFTDVLVYNGAGHHLRWTRKDNALSIWLHSKSWIPRYAGFTSVKKPLLLRLRSLLGEKLGLKARRPFRSLNLAFEWWTGVLEDAFI